MNAFLKLLFIITFIGIGVSGQDMVRRWNELMEGESSGENPCQSDPCPKHSDCNPNGETQLCACHENYIGPSCLLDPCFEAGVCEQGNCVGTCTGQECFANCTCNEMWFGETCALQEYCHTNEPCHGGKCTMGATSHEFKCICNETWTGVMCDIPVCPAEGGYPATPGGQSAPSNDTCTEGLYAGKPTGSRDCELLIIDSAKWKNETTLNCSVGLENITDPNQKASTLEVLTSNPNAVTTEEVQTYTKILVDISGTSNLTSKTADSLISTTNNLMAAGSSASSADLIFMSLANIGSNLQLQDSPGRISGDMYFSQVESSLGVLILKETGATLRAVNGWTMNIDKLLAREDQFAGVRITYGTNSSSPVGKNYISTTNGQKVLFVMYASDVLFATEPRETINSILFSVDTIGKITLKFQLLEWYDINMDGYHDNGTHVITPECVQWTNNSEWKAGNCNETLTFEESNIFLNCTCDNTNGTFAVRMTETVKPITTAATPLSSGTEGGGSGGLEDWVIAVIAVGGVAVIVVVAIIVYCCCCKNKNKGKVETIDSTEMTEQAEVKDKKDEERPASKKEAW